MIFNQEEVEQNNRNIIHFKTAIIIYPPTRIILKTLISMTAGSFENFSKWNLQM